MAKIVKTFIGSEGTIFYIVRQEILSDDRRIENFPWVYEYLAFWTNFRVHESLEMWDFDLEKLVEKLKRHDSTIQLFDLGDYPVYGRVENGKVVAVRLKNEWGYNVPIKMKEVAAGTYLSPKVQRLVTIWKGKGHIDKEGRYLG